MKAVFLDQHGGPEVLQYGDRPDPSVPNNHVLIRLKAASLNHVDIWVRQGLPAYPVQLPHILGADGAGIVEAVGLDAEGVEKGNRVLLIPGISCGQCRQCRRGEDNQCDTFEILGAKRPGTYAELVAVPDQNVLPLPDELSFEIAAAFPLAYLTAWHMLIGRAGLKTKETVLVVGAGSGVGIAAVQIAKWKGVRVLATTTSPEKVDKIKAAGAEEVFVTEPGKGFLKPVLKATESTGVDVVFEHVGPVTWDDSLKSLSRYGRLITCGSTTGPTVQLDLRYVFSRDLSILGARMGTQKEFQEIANVVFDGKITPVIDETFPLSEAQEAHRYMEAKKHVGKILLKMSE